MPASHSNPRLRPVEAFRVEAGGRHLTCLRDPLGLAEQPLFLNSPQAFLVAMMDGTNSLRDIQTAFFRQTSELLTTEILENLVQQLDEQHFLDSPSFRVYLASMVEEFRQMPSRPARHAGTAYAGTADELRQQMDGYVEDTGESGRASSPGIAGPLRGLIAPHIDFQRGGATYAYACNALEEHADADRYIIFGTCHNPMEKRFALTNKDYETPLGAVPTDREFVRRLAGRLPDDFFQDEFAHRNEHSIEFQAVCLRYALGEQKEIAAVPILVGSFHDILSRGETAATDRQIAAMVSAMKETMEELPAKYCVIAGADLAHVGRQFGDPSGPSETYLEEVARADRAFLKVVEEGAAEEAFRSIAAEQDRRRVCGYPPIYMAMRCLNHARGKLLDYRQWADLQAGASVSFAAMAFF